MVDWVKDKVYGRLTFRDLFAFIPNPDSSDAKLRLEKELNWIVREIKEKSPQELQEMLNQYKARMIEALSIKNPYFEEKRGILIAEYMRNVILEIQRQINPSIQVNKSHTRKLLN